MKKSQLDGIAAAALYGLCSVSMAFINKALMTSFNFDFPVFIMVIQMLFTLCLLQVLGAMKVISLPQVTFQRVQMFIMPALFYGINSVLGLHALSHMNVAMYGVLKRCVPLATMFLSVIVLKKGWPSRATVVSVMLITIGCLIASYGDLEFNISAYVSGALSNITHSLYLLLVQKVTETELSTVETLQLNSINTLPFLTMYFLFSNELSGVKTYLQWESEAFWVLFILTIGMGCLLNYSLFLCTSLNSALTTSVVGGVKALMQTIIGIFTFGGISHNVSTHFGIGINLSGSILYLVAKYKEKERKHLSSILGIHKVISVSTAEDFQRFEDGNVMSNKRIKKGTSPETMTLLAIPENHTLQNANQDHNDISTA